MLHAVCSQMSVCQSLPQSKKAEDDLEDKLRDLRSKFAEQETQLEEYKRRVTQLEREKDQLEGMLKKIHLTLSIVMCIDVVYFRGPRRS